MSLSIITPFHNYPELIPAYEAAVRGAEVIIIDNASEQDCAAQLVSMTERLGGVYIRNDENAGFARANNQGLMKATGDVVVFLNSDVEATGDWQAIAAQVKRGNLYGPTMNSQYVDGIPVMYLEGWCLIAHRDELNAIGGWNDLEFPGLYWEDNELCWRAHMNGIGLKQLWLPLRHLSNYTTSRTPGAYDASERNRAIYEAIVREGRE